MGIEFESVTLGQITKRGGGFIQTGPFGSQLHASDYVPTGVPCIMPANIVDGTVDLADIAYISHADAQRLSKHIVKAGDIVYSRRGDVTRKALIRKHEEGMFCGTGCLLVRPGKYIDPRYLAYHLSSPWNHEWIIRHAIGATMPNLNTSILGDIPLKIPDLENQKNIARVLGVFDEKLELNRQINQTLEQMAQALFKSWFVDFDPVIDNALDAGNPIPEELEARAEQRRQFRDAVAQGEASVPGLPDEIRALFPSEFELTDEMGWVPEGWVVSRLDSVLELIYGKALKKSDRMEGEFPVYGSGGVNGNHNVSLVDGPGVIVGRKGTVGSLYWEDKPFHPIDTVFYVKSKEGYPLQYCFYLLKNLGLEHMNTDAAVPGLNRNNAYFIKICVPDFDLIDFFSKKVSSMFNKRSLNLENVCFLENVRDTLLPKLISGELQIPDAEQQLAAALS
jgi:type I restriction enzyme S subunit